MGLQSELLEELAEAFDGDLADAVRPFVYNSVSTGEYDPSQGKTANAFSEHNSRGVFDKVSQDKVLNSSTNAVVAEILILSDELSVTPSKNDFIQEGEDRWVVNDIRIDPAKVVWTLTCSKPYGDVFDG